MEKFKRRFGIRFLKLSGTKLVTNNLNEKTLVRKTEKTRFTFFAGKTQVVSTKLDPPIIGQAKISVYFKNFLLPVDTDVPKVLRCRGL